MADNISEAPIPKELGDGEDTVINLGIFDGMGGEGRKLRDLLIGLLDEVDRLGTLLNGIKADSQLADFASFKAGVGARADYARLQKDGKEFSPNA